MCQMMKMNDMMHDSEDRVDRQHGKRRSSLFLFQLSFPFSF